MFINFPKIQNSIHQYYFDSPISVYGAVSVVDPLLANSAIAGYVNGKLVDVSYIIEEDSSVSILTDKDIIGIKIIRHSSAHLLAHAVKQLYPKAKMATGPATENGFYYDFAVEQPFSTGDLQNIQIRMEELVHMDISINRSVITWSQALDLFNSLNEIYKIEILNSIKDEQLVSIYVQGDHVDLCRGPHIPSTGKIRAFRLIKVAGTYWRNNSKNSILQRIYGTAWANKNELESYFYRIAEAEKRDHRKIGRDLNLFHMQEEAPGMVFWHEHGWYIYVEIQQYIRRILRMHGYKEVHTPQILDISLWKLSGHWDKFRADMFITKSEQHTFAIKPMNCPCHIQIYNQNIHSYRDLPLRLSEFGSCHRNEQSGALHGLMRLRNFTQDDAHIFCTTSQLQDEVLNFIDLLLLVYNNFGFREIQLSLSTRPSMRVGSNELWDKAENALEIALNKKGIPWIIKSGDGAFYGPKIEFSLRDCLGRLWQCGTIQVDFYMPENLGARYIADDGSKKIPVMLHRAILGSIERFIGILIEHYAGLLPTWLAPLQVVILTITERQFNYAKELENNLLKEGFRVKSDLRNEKIGFKIREYTLQRVPYMLVIGDQEVESNIISVRKCSGENLGKLSLINFVEIIKNEMNNHYRVN